MKNTFLKSFTLFLILLFCVCGSSQKDKMLIHATMESWKQALMVRDFDALLIHYSENFTSREAENKEDVLAMFQEADAAGYLDKVAFDLESAFLDIEGDTAVYVIYDDEGEVDTDFTLAREEGNIWRIIGIPSETHSDFDYTQPYGDDGLEYGGFYRAWDIYVPSGLSGKVPLVIDLHGWTETPTHQRSVSGFESLADEEEFIVVWPYGLYNSWNAGEECLPPACEMAIDDVGFIRKLVTQVSGKYKIDPDRIYVTGLSNGSGMAQRLANEASDLIAAAAGFSLHLMVPADPEYTPVSVMILYGTKDDLYAGARENFDKWKEMNRCAGPEEETWRSGNSAAWTCRNSDNGTEVTMVTIDGGGHILYKGEDTEINTTRMAWEFMKRFTKNEK